MRTAEAELLILVTTSRSLESDVIRKRSSVVWGGAVGKVPVKATRWLPTLPHARFNSRGRDREALPYAHRLPKALLESKRICLISLGVID
jgi:hypothetical protein